MSRRQKDPLRQLTDQERHQLTQLSRSQVAPAVEVIGGPRRRPTLRRRGRPPRRPLQLHRPRRRGSPPWGRAPAPVYERRAGADPAGIPPRARPRAGWHGYLVAGDLAAGPATGAGWTAHRQYVDDPGHPVGGRVYLADESHLVPHGDRPAQTEGRVGGHGHRPRRHPQKEVIERAYRTAEGLGLPLYCQDEAGPYQAIPQPGASWQPTGDPAQQPHEYVRGGTAKLLTLFRPATGEGRAEPVERAPNAVLHPWLRRELEAILATCPPASREPGPGRRWEDWLPPDTPSWWAEGLPPLRLLLIWDNLQGHHSWDFEQWCLNAGILPLYTPLGGSWLNMAESVQRILVRRALGGQHPRSAQEVRAWLAATVRGWNAAPTPFEWGGKRAARRARARARRHGLGGSGAYTRRALRRPRCTRPLVPLLHSHAN